MSIAVKEVAPAAFPDLVGDDPIASRLHRLAAVLERYEREIGRTIRCRQNFFTGARRFLVAQVLMGAYFQHADAVNFADLGTGLGILPRQLNSAALFRQFSNDLRWPDGVPAFQSIPLGNRYGVDRPPLPDLHWVRTCYGQSAYYDALYCEILSVADHPDVRRADVQNRAVDLLDPVDLAAFLRKHRINAVNLCYVLYEMTRPDRQRVVDILASSLEAPGLIVITEPRGELTQQGCVVTIIDQANRHPQRICAVSDGHFRGTITPLEDFAAFATRYPIAYQRALDAA